MEVCRRARLFLRVGGERLLGLVGEAELGGALGDDDPRALPAPAFAPTPLAPSGAASPACASFASPFLVPPFGLTPDCARAAIGAKRSASARAAKAGVKVRTLFMCLKRTP